MRLRRYVSLGLAGVAVILIVAAGALGWLVLTESGARFAVARAEALAAGFIRVGAVEGRLVDRVELADLRLEGTGFRVEIDRAELEIDLFGLTAGRLTVGYLGTSLIRVELEAADGSARAPAADASDPTADLPALPVAIELERVSIEGIRIEQQQNVIETERLILVAALDGSYADLRRFETRVEGFFVALQGQLEWSDGLVVDTVVSLAGELAGEEWIGSVHLAGALAALGVEQQLLEPFDVSVAGTVAVIPAPAVDLRIEWADLAAPGLAGLVSERGAAQVAGWLDAFTVAVTSDLGDAELAGGVDLEAERFELSVAADAVAPERFVAGWPGLLGARGSLSGRFGESFRVETDDLVVTAVIDDERLEARFAGAFEEPGVLIADRLELAFAENRVVASGRVSRELDLAILAELDELAAIGRLAEVPEIAALVQVDPRVFALRGNAFADLIVTGPFESPAITGELSFTNARYLDLPLAVSARFERAPAAPGRYMIEQLEASLGASRVTASGSIGDEVSLSLDAMLADLGELSALVERDEIRSLTGFTTELADLAGSARLELSVRGSLELPDIAALLAVDGVTYGGYRLERGLVDLDFDTAPGGRANAVIEADVPEASLRLAAAGSIENGLWRGRLESLTLAEDLLGGFRLDAPVPLALGPRQVDLGYGCLRTQDSSICIEGRYGTGADQIDLSAREFNLATLAPLLPPGWFVTGNVTVDAALTNLSAEAPLGVLSARGSGLTIGVDLAGGERATAGLDRLAVDAELDGYALSLAAELEGPETGRAALTMTSADVRDRSAAISGRLDVYWPDLSGLALLSPEIGSVGGTLEVGLNVAGTTGNPNVDGAAYLNDGSISIPEWGVIVDRINAEALSSDGRALAFTGSGFIEDSELVLSGETVLDPALGWPTELSLAGNEIPLVQRPEMTIIASPDLEATVALPRIDVTGVVVVPRADIAIAALPEQAVRVSPDAVVHGQQVVEQAARPLLVTAMIELVLGDAVHYEGSGLDVDLTGDLLLAYESGRSPNVAGDLSLDGTYEAYGQTLELERGELLFAGPLENPSLDVEAVRRVGSVTVGIRLGGTLLEPSPSVFSNPAMTEADAVAYLLFGRPFEASDEQQAAALQSTALALGLQQALPVVERVGDTLGLDELTIEATDIDASALMAGKYLSPNLYVSYTYGLFNRLGGFLIRYEINDRLSLETRSGNEKSMDLLYSVEKN